MHIVKKINIAEQLITFLQPTCHKFSQVFLIISDILVPDPAASAVLVSECRPVEQLII